MVNQDDDSRYRKIADRRRDQMDDERKPEHDSSKNAMPKTVKKIRHIVKQRFRLI